MALYHVSYVAPLPTSGYVQGDTSVECEKILKTCADYDKFKELVTVGLREDIHPDAGSIVLTSVTRLY